MDVYRKLPKPTNITPTATPATDPGGGGGASVAPLITMIAVLAIILIFCFAGAPAVRQFCRKRICTCCSEPEPDENAEAHGRDHEVVILTSLQGAKNGETEAGYEMQQLVCNVKQGVELELVLGCLTPLCLNIQGDSSFTAMCLELPKNLYRSDTHLRKGTPIDNNSTTPTIILLPFGRMLVVDRSVFAQFQTDDAGLDFMELSANLIRAHHLQYGSTPSILDSETTSKGLSPSSLGFSPPAYEDICGLKPFDLPPSYSEVSLMFKQNSAQEWTGNSGGQNFCVQNASCVNISQNINNNNNVEPPTEHINLSPGTSAVLFIENESVPNTQRLKILASEENFEEFDLASSNTHQVNRVESDSNMHNFYSNDNTIQTRVFTKQNSF